MSCPDLRLCIEPDVPLSKIEEFLSFSLVEKRPSSLKGKFTFEDHLGMITLSDWTHVDYDYGVYGSTWNLVLSFACPSCWIAIRNVLGIGLLSWLKGEFEGRYLAFYDTGTVLLFYEGGVLKVNEMNREYLEHVLRIVLPTQNYRFENLEPV